MDPALVIALGVAFTVVLPLLAVGWLANGRSLSKVQLLVKTLAAGSAVWALYLASVWPMTWYYLRYVVPLAFVGVVITAWWRALDHQWLPGARVREWMSIGAGLLVLASSGYLAVDLSGARDVPEGAVEIEFPFERGAFYVAQGGSHEAVNAHMQALNMPVYRGQVWALDIVQIDGLGRRARGLYPRDPRRYTIFGTPVVAPCAGTVTAVKDRLPDLDPPNRDMNNLAGNFVQIRCEGGFYVVLAHFQRCSVRVQLGDAVAVGDLLGAIGNSGNTTEPHLHIHAQAGPGRAHVLDADPLPIVFRDHGWLARNDVVRVGGSGVSGAPSLIIARVHKH